MKDTQLFSIIEKEQERQETEINLIASENYTSKAVLEATASVLTNKYAEGYPGKRYYAGCSQVDQAELLAIERCKQLFGAEHVNVQPHAGSQANMAVYFALLEPGDTILGMSLAEGGHLTHGSEEQNRMRGAGTTLVRPPGLVVLCPRSRPHQGADG